jgi:hypothetical protein
VLPREHLVEDDPEGVEIAPLVDRVHAERGLGRQVSDGPEDHPLDGEPVGLARVALAQRRAAPQQRHAREAIRRRRDRLDWHLGEAEIDQLGDVVGALEEHDVPRLHVAGDDANRVRGSERRGDLPRDLRGPRRRERPASLDGVVDRAALDVLEHQEIRAVVQRTEVGRGRDVRVLHVGAGDGLALEAGHQLGQILGARVEDLDRDPLLQEQVRAAVDRAHPAHREEIVDPVALGDHAADGRRGAGHRRGVELGLPSRRALGRRIVHSPGYPTPRTAGCAS